MALLRSEAWSAAATPAADFEAVVRGCERPVRRYVAALGVPLADVDDVAQEAFLDFHRGGMLRPSDATPLAWLIGIARHKTLDYFRRRGRAASVRLAEALAAAQRADGGDDALDALRGCVAKLPPDDRELLERYYAEHDGDPVRATSRTRMAVLRLREALRRCVRARLGDAP